MIQANNSVHEGGSGMISVHVTVGSIDEGRRIARHLVERRLVACAQIVPWIESNYLWDGKLEITQESLVMVKTLTGLCQEVCEEIKRLSSYEIPMIAVYDVDHINESYLRWMEETCHRSQAETV